MASPARPRKEQPPDTPSPGGKKFLSLEQWMTAIKMLDSGLSSHSAAAKLGIGCTQILKIGKHKLELVEEYKSNANPEHKRPRMQSRNSVNEDINNLVWHWFRDATCLRCNVSGPLIKFKALRYAKELGVNTFKVSNGWLTSWLKQNNIVLKTMSGE